MNSNNTLQGLKGGQSPTKSINSEQVKQDAGSVYNQLDEAVKRKLQQQLVQFALNQFINQEQTNDQKILEQSKKEDSCKAKIKSFFSLDFFKPYFEQVKTYAVLKRVLCSVLPCKNDFFEIEHPELYGPLWIYLTLVFALYASGNLSLYMQLKKEEYTFQFHYLKTAFSLVFTYALLVPNIVALLMKIFGNETISFFKTNCIYGYSLFVFIPISVISVIPSSIVQICLFSYGTLSSILFLINNFYKEISKLTTQEGETSKKVIVLFTIISLQVITLLLYKFYFFKRIYSSSGNSSFFLLFEDFTNPEQTVQRHYLQHNHHHHNYH